MKGARDFTDLASSHPFSDAREWALWYSDRFGFVFLPFLFSSYKIRDISFILTSEGAVKGWYRLFSFLVGRWLASRFDISNAVMQWSNAVVDSSLGCTFSSS